MNNGADAADQMVRECLQFAEIAIKLSALGVEKSLSIAWAHVKENPKVRGKTNLDRLLREGKELKLISLQAKDLKIFEQYAKQYGVLFASVKDRSAAGEKIDIMFKAEDVSKLNRIYEQMGYTLPTQMRNDRKKGPALRPSGSASRTQGRVAASPEFPSKDPRPSIRAAIRKLKEAARRAFEENQRREAQTQTPVAPREDR